MNKEVTKMTDKKMTVIRIIIFTAVSYGISSASTAVFGYAEDTAGWKIFGFLGISFAPAFANILTRLITREGFSDRLLSIELRENMKYYAVALLLPPVIYTVSANITGLVFVPDYSIAHVINVENAAGYISEILRVYFVSVLLFPLYFGEEYGWRAYLTPKLLTLMPRPAALILSGIIWGLWHAPMIYRGHSFGTNYSSYPYGGYIMMTLLCIAVGSLFTWLTEKTGSVCPACICHSLNNNMGTFLLSVFLSAGMTDEIYSAKQFELVSLDLMPMTVACLPFLIMAFAKNKRDRI